MRRDGARSGAGFGALAPGLVGLALAVALVAAATCAGGRAERGARAGPPAPAETTPEVPAVPLCAPLPTDTESERAPVAPGEDDGTPRGVLATVVARVETPEGTPVGRATLLLRHGARLVERRDLEGPEPVRFSGLEPGRYSLELDATTLPAGLLPRLDTRSATPRVPFVLASGRTTECTLVALPGARPRGIVLDPEGVPVAGARLRLQGLDPALEAPTPEAVSEKDGSFAFEDVLPGRYRALLEWPADARGAAPPPFRLELAADAEPWLELRAEGQPCTIVGRLLDEAGQPLADQLVRGEWDEADAARAVERAGARQSLAPWSLVLAKARTDAEGGYRLEGLPRGTLRLRFAPRLASPRGFGPRDDAFEEQLSRAIVLDFTVQTLDLGDTVLAPRSR